MRYLGLAAKIVGYWLFRTFGYPRMMPMNVVSSVTNYCNSQCKTCDIGTRYVEFYRKGIPKSEMTLEEWIKTWKSIGKVDYATHTGGEPFMRGDAEELLLAHYENLKPWIFNIPHNSLFPFRVKQILPKLLDKVEDGCTVNMNLSVDGIGDQHDFIRGFPGNWNKFLETVKLCKELQERYGCLNITFHTVVSKWNIQDVSKIRGWLIENLRPDVHIMEPSELRYELGTKIGYGGPSLMPPKEKLAEVFSVYANGRAKTAMTKLIRRIYIDKYIKGDGLPCFASFNHTQVTTNGNVWVCCMQGDHEPLGNLRDVDFDFRKIWFSPRADKLRKSVKAKDFDTCKDCYLAVAANTSIIQQPRLLVEYAVRELVAS